MDFFRLRLNALRPLLSVVLLSVLGMSCALSVMNYLGVTPNLLMGWVFMSFVFFIYVINRYTDVKEDFANDIHKVLFFTRHKFLHTSAYIAIISAMGILALLNKFSFFHLFLVAMGLLYSYKVVPWYRRGKGFRAIRIKDVPLIKNLFVSLLWGSAVFAFPILFSRVIIKDYFAIGALAAGLCLSTFSNTVFDDILDEMGDRVAGTKTLPTLLGSKWCYGIIFFTNACWIGLLSLFTVTERLDAAHGIFLIFLALFPAVYMTPYRFKWWKKSVTDILIELDLLIYAGGLTLLTILD